jgi:ornithine cyclodeaminase
MPDPVWVSGERQYAALDASAAADALVTALRAQGRVPSDPPRMALPAHGGELLVMPSSSTGNIGAKLVTVASSGAPRIQGMHVQFDAETLAPAALLEGVALTNLRTAAVSVLALRHLARPDSRDLLVFGAGPQAFHHARGIIAEHPVARVRIATRSAASSAGLIAALRSQDVVADRGIHVERADEVDAAVATADIVVCATTAVRPLFYSAPKDAAAIVAIGSHSVTQRELPGALLGRAQVCVEDRTAALREAGDIVLAIGEGHLSKSGIAADLGELVCGHVTLTAGPRVFKSVGMAWEDSVVAAAIVKACAAG